MNGKLLIQKDVAKQLGIAPARVRIYAAEGLLEYIQLPDLNKPRYTQTQVDTFLERVTRCHPNENHAQTKSLIFPTILSGKREPKTYTVVYCRRAARTPPNLPPRVEQGEPSWPNCK